MVRYGKSSEWWKPILNFSHFMSQCFYSHESFNNLIVIDLLIPQHELYPFIEYQISISIELVFVLCIALKWTSFTFHQTEQDHHPGPRFSDIFHQRYMFRLMAQGIRRFSLFTTRISHLLLHTLGHDGNPNSPFRWISIKQRHIMMST